MSQMEEEVRSNARSGAELRWQFVELKRAEARHERVDHQY